MKVKSVRKQTPNVFTVEVTEGEADFILGLLAYVGGHAKRSPRKYADRIRVALSKAVGYDYDETDAFRLIEGAPFVNFSEYDGTTYDESLENAVGEYVARLIKLAAQGLEGGRTPKLDFLMREPSIFADPSS